MAMNDRTSLLEEPILDDRFGGRCDSRRTGRMIRLGGSLAFLGAALALTPNTFAQTGKKTETSQAPVAPPPLPHDLSGVWIQYPAGPERGAPGMNAIDERFRPP